MGSYKPEWEDYNPVTDRWTRGPMKYVEDEEDKRRKYEGRRRISDTGDIRIYINNIKSSSDYDAIKKAEEAIQQSNYLDSSEKKYWLRELDARIHSWERAERNKSEAAAEARKASKKAYDKERLEKRRAMEDAKLRYKSLSFFGKLKNFKHRPSTIDIYQQTPQEIDQLYRRR